MHPESPGQNQQRGTGAAQGHFAAGGREPRGAGVPRGALVAGGKELSWAALLALLAWAAAGRAGAGQQLLMAPRQPACLRRKPK